MIPGKAIKRLPRIRTLRAPKKSTVWPAGMARIIGKKNWMLTRMPIIELLAFKDFARRGTKGFVITKEIL